MNTNVIKKKVTLMLDAQVYDGLRAKVGGRGIGDYLSHLARPFVVSNTLEDGYKAMATDTGHNKEANEWIGDTHEPIDAENIWEF